jgi:hypothetical protein
VTAKDILLVVIIPLILAEVGPWSGWLAAKLLPRAAKLRYGDTQRAAVRLEEWSSDLGDIPGQLTKLTYAVGQFLAGTAAFAQRKVKGARRKVWGKSVDDLFRSATVTLFRDDDSGFFDWRDAHPGSYFINTERNPGSTYLVLHRSSCHHFSRNPGLRWTKEYVKVCGDDRQGLEEWAAGGEMTLCRTCFGKSR